MPYVVRVGECFQRLAGKIGQNGKVKEGCQMDAFKTLLKQFTKNFEKLPGWVPLLVVVYAIDAILPEDSTVLGLSLKDQIGRASCRERV